MEWLQNFIGDLLFSKSYEAPERKGIADPFNFLLDQYLRHYKANDEEIIRRGMQQFPALTCAEAQQQWQLATAAYTYAAARQYEARDGLLTSDQVEKQVQAHFPQLDADNLRVLLAQTLAGAFK